MIQSASHITIGIDISQKSLDVALCPQDCPSGQWRALPAKKIDHAPDSEQALEALRQWVASQWPQGEGRSAAMVVEATGQLSRRFARAAQGFAQLPPVSIVNPRLSHAFGQSLGVRDKSDAVDARVLALFGEKHRPKPTELPGEEQERLRQRSRLRERYVKELGVWENRLRESLDEEERASIERTIAHLKEEIERVDEAVEKAVEESERLSQQVKVLQKIRGVKTQVARTLTAELGDLATYDRGQVVAVAGLYPKRFESGTSVSRKPRLAKGGGGRVRRVLYLAASSLFRAKGPWPAIIARLSARGFNKMQIIGILMRKLLLIARSVAISGVYDESKIGCGN